MGWENRKRVIINYDYEKYTTNTYTSILPCFPVLKLVQLMRDFMVLKLTQILRDFPLLKMKQPTILIHYV